MKRQDIIINVNQVEIKELEKNLVNWKEKSNFTNTIETYQSYNSKIVNDVKVEMRLIGDNDIGAGYIEIDFYHISKIEGLKRLTLISQYVYVYSIPYSISFDYDGIQYDFIINIVDDNKVINDIFNYKDYEYIPLNNYFVSTIRKLISKKQQKEIAIKFKAEYFEADEDLEERYYVSIDLEYDDTYPIFCSDYSISGSEGKLIIEQDKEKLKRDIKVLNEKLKKHHINYIEVV